MSESEPQKTPHPNIQLLPPQLANQIAAGEVVERPASVVKELIENSIDANADSIHIEIEQGGHKRILIRDTGDGIAKNQLELALSRHATSKIKNIDDLSSILSMGFRGEALASISSVSRLSLCSKPQHQEQAWEAKAEGLDMEVVLSPSAHPKGTSIEVLDLFFNTPARRKFLRAQKTEFQHIEAIVKRIALAQPSVSFTLKHNGKLIYKWAASELNTRISAICGRDFLEKAIPANYKHDAIHLHGWFSKIGEGWSSNERQYIFVNQRMIRDKLVLHAIRQAYEGMLPDNLHPAYVFFLNIPAEQLDINVHPAKHEVRFHQARQVHDVIFQAISQAILDAQHQTENAQSSEVSKAVPQEEIRHDYISPLQPAQNEQTQSERRASTYAPTYAPKHEHKEAPNETLKHTDVRRQSIGGFAGGLKSKASGIDSSVSYAYEQNIAEAGKNYQELMQQKGDLANVPNFLRLGNYLIFQLENDLCAISQLDLVSTSLMHDVVSSDTSQPLLMPVSLAKLKSPTSEQQQRQATIIKQLETLGCEVFIQPHKYLLKQVPSAIRSLPWAHIFARLMEQQEACTSEQACIRYLSQYYLELVTLDNKQLSNMLAILPAESFIELLNTAGQTIAEQDVTAWFESS